jgi:hypothetical protein
MSGSSSEAPTTASIKTWVDTTFSDFHPRPLTLAKRRAYVAPVFPRALAPRLLLLAGGAKIRGSAFAWEGTTYPPMGHRASAIEEKRKNAREQTQQIKCHPIPSTVRSAWSTP